MSGDSCIGAMVSLVAAATRFDEKIMFHGDMSQSIDKVAVLPKVWRLDLCNIAGHKINAPKGLKPRGSDRISILRFCILKF